MHQGRVFDCKVAGRAVQATLESSSGAELCLTMGGQRRTFLMY